MFRKIVNCWSEVSAGDDCNLYSIKRDALPEQAISEIKEAAKKSLVIKTKDPSSLLSQQNLPPTLAVDIMHQFNYFLSVLGQEISDFDLKVQSHFKDSCKLFHGDNVFARMIITYCGPTTEVVEEDNLNRDQLGTSWEAFEEYNCRVLKDRNKIINLEPIWAHVFFGEKSGKLPQIHRAPDIEGTGQVRLTAIGTIY